MQTTSGQTEMSEIAATTSSRTLVNENDALRARNGNENSARTYKTVAITL